MFRPRGSKRLGSTGVGRASLQKPLLGFRPGCFRDRALCNRDANSDAAGEGGVGAR
jgi:hypothetical protein